MVGRVAGEINKTIPASNNTKTFTLQTRTTQML